jgi:hypothetical protein
MVKKMCGEDTTSLTAFAKTAVETIGFYSPNKRISRATECEITKKFYLIATVLASVFIAGVSGCAFFSVTFAGLALQL